MNAVPIERPTFISSVFYKDPKAALAWLERAFGFETSMLIESPDDDDRRIHSEMRFGTGTVFVGGEWEERVKSPKSVAGANTQSLHVEIQHDIDGHCARARAAGAVIVQEPDDQFYGDRIYRAFDPEGHCWTFFQTVRPMSIGEMEAASGLTIKTSL